MVRREIHIYIYIYTRKRCVWEDQGGPRGRAVGAMKEEGWRVGERIGVGRRDTNEKEKQQRTTGGKGREDGIWVGGWDGEMENEMKKEKGKYG